MLAFFDYSFVDTSFKTRSGRQLEEISKVFKLIKKLALATWEEIELKAWRIRRRLRERFFKQEDCSLPDFEIIGSSNSSLGEKDMTINQHINKHGGIYSNADRKVYTTKGAYLDSLKANNKHIVDY